MHIRLEDFLKTSWKTKSVKLKTSSRRLDDVLENKKCLVGLNFKKETLLEHAFYRKLIFLCQNCLLNMLSAVNSYFYVFLKYNNFFESLNSFGQIRVASNF